MKRDKEQEFAWFYQGEFAPLVRTIDAMVRERELAQEIAQEAFIRALARWEVVSRYERPDHWVRKVAVRLALKSLRRKRLLARISPHIEPPQAFSEMSDPDLMRAVAALPPSQRAAVALFYLEDRPLSEVAEVLGCSASTAGVHLHRARKRLAEMLGEEMTDASR